MQNNTLLPYKYEFGVLSDAYKTKREFRELALWPDDSEPVNVTSREYWVLTDVLRSVRGIDPQFFNNALKVDAIMRANTPKKLNPGPIDAHINVKMTGVQASIELSRYACWTLMKEIGKSVPTVFQQEYFLNPGKKLGEICAAVREPGRIPLRERATKLEKQLHGILGKLIKPGTPTQFASKYHSELNSYIARNLYGNVYSNVQDIKFHNHIPPKAALCDYMNYDLLSAYCNALENIIEIYDNQPDTRKTFETLYKIIYNEITQARTLFVPGRPEQSFSKTPVCEIQKLQTMRELEFAKRFINVKLH